MKRSLAILLSVACLALIAAWAAPAQAVETGPVKIGVILPITGPAAPYGQAAHQGMLLALEHQPTVLGRKVELVLADNRSDKIESSSAANRLIQRDQVAVIIGPLSSSTTMAAAPVAEKAGNTHCQRLGHQPGGDQGQEVRVFAPASWTPSRARWGANFALHDLKAKTAAVMIDISRDYSVGLSAFFQRAFKAGGGKILMKTMYSSGDQEFSAQLGAIKAKKPDVIYLPGYFPELPLIIRQAREMGINQPFVGGDAAQADEVLKIGGPAVEGLYLSTHFDEGGATTEAGKRYSKAYRAKYGKAPDAMGALGYDAYMIVLAAMEKAGSLRPDKIAEALSSIKGFPGVCGVTDMQGRDAIKPAVVLKVKDGKYVYVTSVKP